MTAVRRTAGVVTCLFAMITAAVCGTTGRAAESTVEPAAESERPLAHAVNATVEAFLGAPLFIPMQQLWEKRGGWGGVLTAPDGTAIVFRSGAAPAGAVATVARPGTTR